MSRPLMAPVSVAPVQISDEKGANRNRFPTGFYYREIEHTLHNVKMTFKLDVQVVRYDRRY